MGRTVAKALDASEELNISQILRGLDKVLKGLEGLAEWKEESRAQMEKARAQMEDTDKKIKELTAGLKGMGVEVKGISDSLSKFTEQMFSANLCEKFAAFGYTFSRSHSEIFWENRIKIAQVDIMLENGEYAMLVEVKFTFRQRDVDEHVKRMEKVRAYFDEHGDKRILLGAIACGGVSPSVMKYAENNGFYVMVQNGETVTVVEKPKTFKPRKWK